MYSEELVKKYFGHSEADYMLYNFECLLCGQEFEPDTSQLDLVMHLKINHPKIREFK